MKKFRPSHLIKFLQAIRQPLFLLDESSTMLFCNRALEEWTGCNAEQLFGLRLRYRAAASRLKHEIVAASLAPPPEVFQGKRCKTFLTIDRITSLSRRAVDFIPLAPGGVLALVDENEATSSDIEDGKSESAERQEASELHQTLLAFRRRQAGRFRWDRMIGMSRSMQRVRRQARLAVDSIAAVLIVGESGTGKEHLASAIHYGFPGDPPGAMLPIECAVLDPELIASTLSAFRKRFQQDKSNRRHTLLLKDADALPASLVPLVADFVSAAAVNQRLIATTTLKPELWSGDDSLPILLGTIQIELPPLRERREDIPLLAQMFLEEQNKSAERQRAGFTSDALDDLVQYHWPGNIGELELLVDEVHEKGTSPLVSLSELPARIRNVFDAASHRGREDEPIELDSLLGRIERELIERALQRSRGNKTKAAELLGLTRPRLYRRMLFFGLIDEDDSESDV